MGVVIVALSLAFGSIGVAWAIASPIGNIPGTEHSRDLIGVCWLLAWALLAWGRPSEGALRGQETARGSAVWATAKQLGRLLRPRIAHDPARAARAAQRLERGAFLVGQWDRRRDLVLPPPLVQQHALVCGPPGAGKTRAWMLPNAALATGSVVCTDPKGELYEHTAGYHVHAWRFAPREAARSVPFNWIPRCADPRLAMLLAEAIIQPGGGDTFFTDGERQVCAALFAHTASTDTPTSATAKAILASRDVVRLLEESEVELARRCAVMLRRRGETAGNLLQGVDIKLSFLDDPDVARFTSSTLAAPDFSTLLRDPVAVYWVLHEQDVEVLRPLTCLFFTVLLDQLTRAPLGGSQVPVVLLLDEFANLGTLPNFAGTISLARGRGLGLVLGVQALSQLDARYGKESRTILNCCSTRLFTHGLERDTAEYVSDLLGVATIGEHSVSRGAKGETGRSEHTAARPLLTPDEVRRLSKDEALLIAENWSPVRFRKRWWSAPPRPGRATTCGPVQCWEPAR